MAENSTIEALKLQDLCMIELINDLEHYPPDLLARLPARFRRQLLCNLPVLDLCKLEHTPVAQGVELNSVWKEKYPPWNNLDGLTRVRNVSYFIVRSKEDVNVDWKQEYMSILCHSVLETQAAVMYTSMRVYQYVEKYQCPVVDWLVTVKAAHFLKPNADAYLEQLERLTPLVFVEAENAKRLDRIVPVRYVKMRSDAAAMNQEELLGLIVNQCKFRPRFLTAEIFKLHSTPLFSHTSTQNQRLLNAILSSVEELQVCGSVVLVQPAHPSVSINVVTEIPKTLLKAPNIKSLQIEFNTFPNTSVSAGGKSLAELFLNSFSPCIFSLAATPTYTGLTKLCFKDSLDLNCIPLMASMIEQQVNLEHLALDTLYSDRLKSKDASLKPLLVAITTFFGRANFHSLKVSFASFHASVLRYLFGSFLTVGCSHEQKFYLKKVVATSKNTSPFVSFEDWTDIPTCGTTHKEICSLDDFGLGASIYSVLFSLPIVQMKTLQVSVNHWDMESLHTAAQHPDLYIEELCLVLCSSTSTLAEDLKKLFQIPTLKKASVTLRTNAELSLPLVADALTVASSALLKLELIGCDFTSMTENCMALLFDSIFSLGQIADLSVDISQCGPPGLLLPLIADTILTSYAQRVEDTGDESPLKELVVPQGHYEDESYDDEEDCGERDSIVESMMLLPIGVVENVVFL